MSRRSRVGFCCREFTPKSLNFFTDALSLVRLTPRFCLGICILRALEQLVEYFEFRSCYDSVAAKYRNQTRGKS